MHKKPCSNSLPKSGPLLFFWVITHILTSPTDIWLRAHNILVRCHVSQTILGWPNYPSRNFCRHPHRLRMLSSPSSIAGDPPMCHCQLPTPSSSSSWATRLLVRPKSSHSGSSPSRLRGQIPPWPASHPLPPTLLATMMTHGREPPRSIRLWIVVVPGLVRSSPAVELIFTRSISFRLAR
jgi:hypothetical protein